MTLVKFNNPKKANGYSSFNELFDSFLNDGYLAPKPTFQVPAVNVSENENAFILDLAAPGLKKEYFKIALEKDVLTISADVENEVQAENVKVTKQEFNFHSFFRSFNLPELVDHAKIEAKYENGILQVNIPKKEEAKVQSRQIDIK